MALEFHRYLPLQLDISYDPVYILIFASVMLAIWCIVCYLVYRDAKRRGMSGALWFVVVFLASIIGLIVYLVIREPKRAPGAEYQSHPSGYAPAPQRYQGSIPEGARLCKKCGAPLEPETKFCRYCGQRI
jgi:hypothetical protein